jgi:amidase
MVYALPIGLSFFGNAYIKPKLIVIAFAYEQAPKHKVKPEFKKSFLSLVVGCYYLDNFFND